MLAPGGLPHAPRHCSTGPTRLGHASQSSWRAANCRSLCTCSFRPLSQPARGACVRLALYVTGMTYADDDGQVHAAAAVSTGNGHRGRGCGIRCVECCDRCCGVRSPVRVVAPGGPGWSGDSTSPDIPSMPPTTATNTGRKGKGGGAGARAVGEGTGRRSVFSRATAGPRARAGQAKLPSGHVRWSGVSRATR